MAAAKPRGPSRDTRGAILVGAGRVFGRLGYANSRVEDILQESGVSRATFYKFFDSKESVFLAIEDAFAFSFMQAMDRVDTTSLGPIEQAAEYVDTYLRWVLGWRDVARVMWTDPTRPRAGSVIEARVASHRAVLDLIARLAADMGMSTEDPYRFRGLLGAISEIAQGLIEAPRVSDAELRRAREAIIRFGIACFDGLAAPEVGAP